MKNRIISSVLLFLIFIPFIIKGESYFAGLILIVGIVAFHELFHLKLREKKLSILIEILSYLAVGFLILNNCDSKELVILLDYRILTFMLFAFMMPLVIIGDNEKYNLQDALYLLGSVLFVGFSFNLVILIRNYSIYHFIYLLIIAFFTDIYAYLTGKLIGKYKLVKKISPSKTIEGFVGGIVIGVFAGVLFYLAVINSEIPITQLIIITTTLSIMGQIGDLVFSQIKRFYHQKDFSNLIPGHGGILDLFDSLIFVVITSILFISIL